MGVIQGVNNSIRVTTICHGSLFVFLWAKESKSDKRSEDANRHERHAQPKPSSSVRMTNEEKKEAKRKAITTRTKREMRTTLNALLFRRWRVSKEFREHLVAHLL